MSYSGSQMQAVMAKISSDDGLTISRTMPTMLSDHMSNIHWNTFCEEVEEATTTSTATTVNTPEPLVPLKKVDEDSLKLYLVQRIRNQEKKAHLQISMAMNIEERRCQMNQTIPRITKKGNL